MQFVHRLFPTSNQKTVEVKEATESVDLVLSATRAQKMFLGSDIWSDSCQSVWRPCKSGLLKWLG